MANSEFWGSDWDLALSRDVFWENSMHGVFEENAGVFPKVFKSEDDYFSYLSETAFLLLSVVTKLTILNQYALKTI